VEQWYALHTEPNAEYHVVEVLHQREIETYLPEVVQTNSKKGKRKQPFFPCYLFAKIDFKQVGFASVRWTPGLRRVVAFSDQPVPLPEELIDLIRQKITELETANGTPQPGFKPGELVQIKEGPFQDMLAIFAGPTTPAQRVQVLLEILGQVRRVRVDLADLKKAPATAEMPTVKLPRRTRGRGRRIDPANKTDPPTPGHS
jgi:transcriptional antiterminator RfaH